MDEKLRVRINFKVTAKGIMTPDVSSEATDVETAMKNLKDAHDKLTTWAKEKGYEVPGGNIE